MSEEPMISRWRRQLTIVYGNYILSVSTFDYTVSTFSVKTHVGLSLPSDAHYVE